MKFLFFFIVIILASLKIHAQDLPDSLCTRHDTLTICRTGEPFTGLIKTYYHGLLKNKLHTITKYKGGVIDSVKTTYFRSGVKAKVESYNMGWKNFEQVYYKSGRELAPASAR